MRRIAYLLVLWALMFGVVAADDDEVKLTYSGDGASMAAMGRRVALDGDTLVAAAPDILKAIVFHYANDVWSQHAILTPSNSETMNTDMEVDISGDTIVIGAPYRNVAPNRGSVHIFTRSGSIWTEQTFFGSPDTLAPYDNFGIEVNLIGDTLMVGSSAAVYFYNGSGANWTLQSTLPIPAEALGCNLFFALDESKNRLVLGAPCADKPGGVGSEGAVFVYERSGATWNLVTTLYADDALSGSNLGWQVAISGTTIAAVSTGYPTYGLYIFDGENWTNQSKFAPGANQSFSSVAVEGERVIAGAPGSYTPPYQGSTYVYTRNGGVWAQSRHLQASDGYAGDNFGTDVAISGSRMVAGGRLPYYVFTAGAVYVYESGAISTPPAVRVVGLEAIQVIQDWNNSVPLIANKPTIVRAHVQPVNSSTPVDVRLELHGERNGVALPGSPRIPHQDATVRAYANAVHPDNRASLERSPYFELPQSWPNGDVTLILRRSDGGVLTCPGTTQALSDGCAITKTFQPMPALQVKFIAVDWGDGSTFPTYPDRVELKNRLLSIYPIASVDMQRGAMHYGLPGQPNLSVVNLSLASMKFFDGCGTTCKRIYYGVVKSANPLFSEGLSNLGVASGYMMYSPLSPGLYGRFTHAHEIGHLFGRGHPPYCGATDYFDMNFPYTWINPQTGERVATLGPFDRENMIYGYDSFRGEVVDPRHHFELMSYCKANNINPGFEWISKYTYIAIQNAINSTFSTPSFAVAAGGNLMQTTAGEDNYLIARGMVDTQVDTANFEPFAFVSSPDAFPLPTPGAYTLEFLNASNNVLSAIPFAPDTGSESSNFGLFLIAVPADPAITQARIAHNGNVIGSITASAYAPTITITAPNGGETIDSTPFDIQWIANDPDGGDLTALIQYSWNGGVNWETVTVDLIGSSYTVDPATLRGTDSALFRVQVSDGFNTATDQSDAVFSVVAKAPEIVVHSPADGAVVEANVPLRLFASAYDVEDGEIPSENFTWTSDVDGALGTGSDINVILSLGTHTLTVTASDSDSNAPSVPLTITVTNVVNDDFDLAKVVNFVPYMRTQTTVGATYVPQDQVPYCGNAIGATVWYRFTAPADAIYTFETLGSDYDTVLALWTGEHGAMIPAGCNDDAGGQQSILELPLTEGTTYHIMIAGNDGATGSLTFNLSSPTPILDAPDDYSATENRQPTFSWSAASGAVSYEIRISQQYPPEGMPISLMQTSYTPPSPLFTATYYWRARAVRGDSMRTDWSETRILTIIAPSNAAPIRYFYTTPTPTLTWNRISWATTYQAEIYDNEGLTGTPIDTFTGDALEMTTIPLTEGVYYWRVRGIGPGGAGAWGKAEAFGVGG